MINYSYCYFIRISIYSVLYFYLDFVHGLEILRCEVYLNSKWRGTSRIFIPYRSRIHYTVFLTQEYAVLGRAITSVDFQGRDFNRQFMASVEFCTMNRLSELHCKRLATMARVWLSKT